MLLENVQILINLKVLFYHGMVKNVIVKLVTRSEIPYHWSIFVWFVLIVCFSLLSKACISCFCSTFSAFVNLSVFLCFSFISVYVAYLDY